MSSVEQNDQAIKRKLYYVKQLPEIIEHNGVAYCLEYNYDFDTVDRCYVSYSSFKAFPHKKVFSHFEESTFDLCVLKTWRELFKKDASVLKGIEL